MNELETTKEKEEQDVKLQEDSKKQEEMNNSLNLIKRSIQSMAEITDRYKMYAKILNVEWATEVPIQSLEELYSEIQVAKETENAEDTRESGSYISFLQAVQDYSDANCEKQIITELNKKVNRLIKKSKLDNIDAKIEELENTKIGFFGRIAKKDKEIELKKKNLVLSRSLIELLDAPDIDEYCNPDEILAKIISYRNENEGILSEELETLEMQMKKVFKTNHKEVKRLVEKNSSKGMLVPQQQSRFMSRRKTNNLLQQINQKLEEEVSELRAIAGLGYKEQERYEEKATDNIQKAYNSLKKIRDSFIGKERSAINIGNVLEAK